jgi:CRISPR-associated endonuclease/helicase Cas3
MLAERLADGKWPKALDLPTAAGKTACIDVAIYALAAQAEKPVGERTAPRRMWFVVDRRIVVDEAFERARKIAEKLREAKEGPLKAIADRLLAISGTERPLAVARLRGGVLRDDGWARLPSQPAVITSTVDQLGSRLLFRGYGHGARPAPIFAGLAAHDSLILLDEAHLSVPFLQTLNAVERYRGEKWAEQPIQTPFAFAMLSATPPADISPADIFPGAEREAALDHPELKKRMTAAKPAELVAVPARRSTGTDPLVEEAAARAEDFALEQGLQRVGVVVNRVKTASEIAAALCEALADRAHVVLLTGRLRPLERDELVGQWQPLLRANDPAAPDKPVILVATQCIEVGADFSFDALVTEAASLDALRQRFGRLNRMGAAASAPAAILIRADEAEEGIDDPVYGPAMSNCWRRLNELATSQTDNEDAPKVIDFGVEALDKRLEFVDDLQPYLAPVQDAPLLLPSHLDLLCQTEPLPHVEPDVHLYLHGTGRGAPEVRVVWRADLDPVDTGSWAETIALCPPNSLEALSVPLYRLRRWLSDSRSSLDTADVEGARTDEEEIEPRGRGKPALVWRGRERELSRVIPDPDAIRPGDMVVLPATYGIEGLGQPASGSGLGKARIDLWERGHKACGKPPALRLNRDVLQPWLVCASLKELVALVHSDDWTEDDLQSAIDAVLDDAASLQNEATSAPQWLKDLLRETRHGRREQHPAGGIVLIAPAAKGDSSQEQDLFADDDDLLSATGREVRLDVHSALVERAVAELASRCLPVEFHDALKSAAYWHDAGKLDERFQIWLREGDELAALASEPLAKSRHIAASPARRRQLRQASGLPDAFRHEMLSFQLAERFAPLPDDEAAQELILQCVAAHHGYGRPFAPVSFDSEPPPVQGRHDGAEFDVTETDRRSWPAPHSIAFGQSERFWRLTRRYGWWGLAYLEAIVRLGDWYGSRWTDEEPPARPAATSRKAQRPTPKINGSDLLLTGIDGSNPLGFLAAIGTLVVLHYSGQSHYRLRWQRGVSWQPELVSTTELDPETLVQQLANGLRGSVVSEAVEQQRKEAQERRDRAVKAVRDKHDEIRKRGLSRKDRETAEEKELAPLRDEAMKLEEVWRSALRNAVPSPEIGLGKHIDLSAEDFRRQVRALANETSWNNSNALALCAAFGSDACINEKKETVSATPFCFITGSGKQYFLDTARQLMDPTRIDTERLKSTLFESWTYADPRLSMRWDPIEARRYALMDRDPEPIGSFTVWMANLLAYRALALFPSAPRARGLATTGWSSQAEGDSFTWPLWTHPVGPDTVRSLLLLAELHEPAPDRAVLRALGIQAAYRSRRIKVGAGNNFKINFSPAKQV